MQYQIAKGNICKLSLYLSYQEHNYDTLELEQPN